MIDASKMTSQAKRARAECLTERSAFALDMCVALLQKAAETDGTRDFKDLSSAASTWFKASLSADERAEGAELKRLREKAAQKEAQDDLAAKLRAV